MVSSRHDAREDADGSLTIGLALNTLGIGLAGSVVDEVHAVSAKDGTGDLLAYLRASRLNNLSLSCLKVVMVERNP